ncbi:hypothetical protein GPL21_29545 [Bradyrhizobium pachyrhizi]|uniref:Uncharacterized protein n=1 Tax=Bradyrhizobium pachyrhizi TaxID=280333 RepID=A0A844T2E0_9BRAD|nr:hypothetical protein [Bradyrhizobium pachyrhizi]MVT69241.1 hypothetical protein [Bradyrhizobium pachyrhizi]WFU58626.1 hypothetical protein QA639_14495 [Bradyrhizobium pachyrhizi]
MRRRQLAARQNSDALRAHALREMGSRSASWKSAARMRGDAREDHAQVER